ncbi:MAG: septum formation initiator family protein, partial [Desulfatiglandales bacterium]|nr:septum formation initiator family protein [Desulfatiglandales bacterium]
QFSFFALLFLGLMIAWLGFGERGFVHLYQMEKERRAFVEKILQLENENHKLLEVINRLRTDNEYIESVARRELGLLKDGEILYRFSREDENDNLTEEAKK